jgi:RimJ/RimL family protein N-acetyltransferase
MRLHKIRLDVYANNPAVKTYERVGFRKEGLLREEAFRKGRHLDVIRMGLLGSELRSHKPRKR